MKLDELIAPIPKDEFFGENPLWIADQSDTRQTPLFSLEDAISAVQTFGWDSEKPGFGIHREGSALNLAMLAAQDPDQIQNWLPKFFAKHWSLLCTHTQLYSTPIRELSDVLAAELDSKVWVNAYLTPSHSQCFAPHADSHSVLIWQQEGQKHWKISAPDDASCERPLIECILDSGQLLYIPEGFPHVATCEGDQLSVHLTIAFHGSRRRANS